MPWSGRHAIGPMQLLQIPMAQWDWLHFAFLVVYVILSLIALLTAFWFLRIPFRLMGWVSRGVKKRLVEKKEDSL